MKIRYMLVAATAGLLVLAGCTSTPHDTEMMDDSTEMMDDSTEMMDDSAEMMDDSAEMMDDSAETMDDSAEMSMMSHEFVVTIEVLSDGPTPLAPVAWAVHEGDNPFVRGAMGRLAGLESLAEDGDPSMVAATLGQVDGVVSHGVANTPDGEMAPGPALPGHSYSFAVTAADGQRLSFATMFVQSNDLFFSPDEHGIPLFDMAVPANGVQTSLIRLYDAGTETNEEPGMGANQAPRQSGANMGMSEDMMVMAVSDVMDGYEYPAVASVIRVTVTPVK